MQTVSCIVPASGPLPCALVLQEAIGCAIRARRKALGISQRELALRARTHRPLIARAERGMHALTLDSLIRYANAFGCTVSDLVLEAEGQTRARSSAERSS
jgi:transcriptional regulator with XRE-family HTH domain